MTELREKLLKVNIFDNNEYFEKYINLIQDNIDTKREKYKTQKHHIIPKCYFKLKKIECDNSSANLVNLLYKDHILAHYYLERCLTEPELRGRNFFAIYKLCGSAGIDQEQLHSILQDEKLLDEFLSYQQYGKLFSDSHRKHLSEVDKLMIYVYKDDKQTKIYPEDLDKYLADGWKRGGRPGRLSPEHKKALAMSHKNPSDKFRQEQSIRTTEYFMTHIDARRRRSYPVEIYDDNASYAFQSCFEAGQFIGLPAQYVKCGKFSEWIKLGYIKYRKSKYNGWKIKKLDISYFANDLKEGDQQ